MSELVHLTVRFDKEQGGFKEGTGATMRVFILWAIILYRLIELGQAKFAVFVDLASLFVTISAAITAVAATQVEPGPVKSPETELAVKQEEAQA